MASSRDVGMGRGSLRGYAIGFALSVLLTAIPFAMVMQGGLPRRWLLLIVFAAAVLQILVHLRAFLHLDASSGGRWNLRALLMAILIMVLIVGGTLWIMAHLSYRLS